MIRSFAAPGALLVLVLTAMPTTGRGAEMIRPAQERFGGDEVTEVPDFQRHVLPLMGRLGCNGRACHGSFQGQGGFRLSLFGYDFKVDHEALLDKKAAPPPMITTGLEVCTPETADSCGKTPAAQ